MCSVLNEIQEKGRAEGRSEGHTEGWSDAKNYYIEALIQNLMSENPSLSKDSARKRATPAFLFTLVFLWKPLLLL